MGEDNQIKTIESLSRLPNLEVLELRANKLVSTLGIDAHSIRELYLVW